MQAVRNVLSDFFITKAVEVESRFKKTPYKFIQTALTNKAETRALDKIFDCSLDRWTQPTLFTYAFTIRSPESSRLTFPIEQFIKRSMDETAKEWRLTAKTEGFP